MSCHSSHNLGPLAAARATSDLEDDQISKVFHNLKKQAAAEYGKDEARRHVDPQEVVGYLSHLRERVAHDPRITDAKRERILARLDSTIESVEATGNPRVDQATFTAWQQLPSASTRTMIALDNAIFDAADRMNIPSSEVSEQFNAWRDDKFCPDINLDDPQHPHLRQYMPTDPDLPTDRRTQLALRRLAWETYLSEPAPVFVYGTLRTGQHNSVLFRDGYEAKVPAQMDGIALHATPVAGFPWGVDEPDSAAHGEVVFLRNDERGDEVRESLDYLEGFMREQPRRSMYTRSLRTATVADENGQATQIAAWVYVATPPSQARFGLSPRTRIPSGDWFEHIGFVPDPVYATR